MMAKTTQLLPRPVFTGPCTEPSWNHDAAAHAAITGCGVGPAELWPLLDRFGLARHLTPARAG